jgi:hypothetical protein
MTPEQRLADVFVALAGGTTDGPLDVSGTLSVLARRSPALLGAGAAAGARGHARDGFRLRGVGAGA